MKIIRKQNQESIEPFHNKRRITVLLLPILLIVIFTISIFLFFQNKKHSPMTYKSPEEVRNLIEDNRDEFKTIMGIIYQNQAFDRIYEKSVKSSVSDYRKFKKFMPENEYILLEEFCLKYKPSFLRKNSISFNTENNQVEIFSCKDMSLKKTQDYLVYREQNGNAEKLFDDLYFFVFLEYL